MDKKLFLQILLDSQVLASLNEQGYDALLRILRQTDLVSSFGFLTKTHENQEVLPVYMQSHVNASKVFSDAQTRQVFSACALIKKAADDLGIELLFLKGAAYCLRQTQNSRGRLFSDIDILVKVEDLNTLESYLNANGWKSKELNDYDDKYYREWSHELPPFTHLATGVSLDIHHTLLPKVSHYRVDIEDLWRNELKLNSGFSVPNHAYLILHSAIHLLLNEDVEKGFRDLLDINLLIIEYMEDEDLERLKAVFCRSGFEFEFDLLIELLNKCFDCRYKLPSTSPSYMLAFWCNAYYKSIFPAMPELQTKTYRTLRLLVYIKGHLNKMPFRLFIKHIIYKASRSLTKKLFGEFIFK